MMFIPGQNQLAKPEVVAVPPFEKQLERFKALVVEHIAVTDPATAEQVAVTLNNEAELTTKIVEACTIVLQTRIREVNEDALQMFAYWSEGSNLDAVVSDLGLERQTISEGDPDAFPPVPAAMESDDQLRLRYFLAPFGFSSAGPGLGYKYHAITLGERPVISVETPSERKVVVTYEFDDSGFAGSVKDATGVRTDAGKVSVPILSRDGDGTPSDELVSAVERFFERDDAAPCTDEITVSKAVVVPYTIRAVAYISKGPDESVIREQITPQLKAYADEQHRLKGFIEPGMIEHLLRQAGAQRPEIIEPVGNIETAYNEAPYCQSIELEIRTL